MCVIWALKSWDERRRAAIVAKRYLVRIQEDSLDVWDQSDVRRWLSKTVSLIVVGSVGLQDDGDLQENFPWSRNRHWTEAPAKPDGEYGSLDLIALGHSTLYLEEPINSSFESANQKGLKL